MKYVSDIITRASGSLGRLSFSQGATGGQIKGRAQKRQVATAAQFTAQQILSAISKEWSGLAPAARENWSLVAATQDLTDILGNVYHLSGHGLYTMLNANQYYTGQARTPTAPLFAESPPGLTSLALTATVSAGATPPDVFTATLGSNPAGYALLIKATPMTKPGVAKPADSSFKLVGHIPAGFGTTVDLLTPYLSALPRFTLGMSVSVRLSLVSPAGYAGPAITTRADIVA